MNEVKQQKLKFPIASILLWLYAAVVIIEQSGLLRYGYFNYFIWIDAAVLIAIGVFSLMNKPMFVFYGTCAYAALHLIEMVVYHNFGIYSILWLLAGLLLAFVIATQLLSPLESMKKLGKTLAFLPSVLYLISLIIYIMSRITKYIEDFTYYKPSFFEAFFHTIQYKWADILLAIGMFFLISRIIDPYAKEKPVPAAAPMTAGVAMAGGSPEEIAEIHCPMIKHFLLYMFTFGIWYYIWIYKTTKYLNRAPQDKQCKPTTELLLCLFIPFYSIYWYYVHGKKLEAFLNARKLYGDETASFCLLCGIFAPPVACMLMQDKCNQLCHTSL